MKHTIHSVPAAMLLFVLSVQAQDQIIPAATGWYGGSGGMQQQVMNAHDGC